MTTKKQVEIVLRIKLRDYGAFEDLAEELGYPIQDIVRVGDIEVQPNGGQSEPEPPTNKSRNRFNRVTRKTVEYVKRQPDSVTNMHIARTMPKSLAVGDSTISLIRHGKYDHLLEN